MRLGAGGRALLIVLAVQLAAACAPPPAVQAELCAIQALPGRPGQDRLDAPLAEVLRTTLDPRGQTRGQAYGPAVAAGPALLWWGRCPVQAGTTEMILLGPGPYAMTKGGPRTRGGHTAFGTCYHLKAHGRWRTLACRINPAS